MIEYISNAGSQIFNELNYRLSKPEIMSAAMSLKHNKAPGTDSIINKMIKSRITIFTPLFNSFFTWVIILIFGAQIIYPPTQEGGPEILWLL